VVIVVVVVMVVVVVAVLLDSLLSAYNSTLSSLLDKHAPVLSKMSRRHSNHSLVHTRSSCL